MIDIFLDQQEGELFQLVGLNVEIHKIIKLIIPYLFRYTRSVVKAGLAGVLTLKFCHGPMPTKSHFEKRCLILE